MEDQPCRDFLIFRERTEMELEERRKGEKEQDSTLETLKKLVEGQNIRISLLEQQNRLTFWVYGLITTGLVGVIIRLTWKM